MMGSSVVAELEGTLLKDPSIFSYFMLVAFEASGLLRFVVLLLLWPLIRMLEVCGRGDDGIKLTIFIATAGVPFSDVERVSNAVLTKFLYDDIEMEAWRFFSSYKRRVVVTKMPRVMVERFVKEHLSADCVVGSELGVNRFGFVTGFVEDGFSSISGKTSDLFRDEEPSLGLGRSGYGGSLFFELCKEQRNPPFEVQSSVNDDQIVKPLPVIFHDGRLVKRPTPAMGLLILLWLPIGVLLAVARIIIGLLIPMNTIPIFVQLMGGKLIVKGTPPPPCTAGKPGFLFVCTHRTLLDPVVLSCVLQRRIPTVTYSLSRVSEILAPIPTIRLTRVKELDAETIRKELEKGDLVVCPEGTTCREPFLLRFSALFAQLTDRIVPVAVNNRAGFFHGTTARGWKALDAIFFFMNPHPAYEVTFLNQLPLEATCSSGKSPYEVANYVQKILAGTLGFECTNLTRKDKYRILAGNDGTVDRKSCTGKEMATAIKKMIGCFR